jgi:hypothetical protein
MMDTSPVSKMNAIHESDTFVRCQRVIETVIEAGINEHDEEARRGEKPRRCLIYKTEIKLWESDIAVKIINLKSRLPMKNMSSHQRDFCLVDETTYSSRSPIAMP